MLQIEYYDGSVLTGSDIEIMGDVVLVSGTYYVNIDEIERITIAEV